MYYLVDVTRGRFEFPALKAKALALAQQYSPTRILIEDVGTGTALIQELRKAGRVVVPVRAEQDKITRMAIQSAKFEAGMVYLPEAAPWLSVFEEELFAFPSSKYFDQVDTVSQILGHQPHHHDRLPLTREKPPAKRVIEAIPNLVAHSLVTQMPPGSAPIRPTDSSLVRCFVTPASKCSSLPVP